MRQVTAGQTIRRVFVLLFFSAFLFSLTGWPAAALTPEEKLADPILEDRARALSKQLRCLVCQNQSIDDSDAELAKDLRREVRSLLQTGASDAAILERIQNSYGDYVLLRPPVSTQTLLLWLAPVLILTGVDWSSSLECAAPACIRLQIRKRGTIKKSGQTGR